MAITLVEPREHRLLRNIEAATRTKLEIARLPTVADLRERRTEILRANLREALLADGYDRFRGVVEPLTDEFDLVDIALAAVSLVEGAAVRGGRRGRAGVAAPRAPGRRRVPPARSGAGRARAGPDRSRRAPAAVPAPGRRPAGLRRSVGPAVRRRWRAGPGSDPGDLVGAITNEAGVPGSVVGAIQINDAFSLVDVQASVADDVGHALAGATIRGRRLQVRRDR